MEDKYRVVCAGVCEMVCVDVHTVFADVPSVLVDVHMGTLFDVVCSP